MKKNITPMLSRIVETIEDKKAQDVVVLDMAQVVSYTDFLIICSGTSTTQVSAIVSALEDAFPKGEGLVYINSSTDDSWWILDFVEVVVHVFKEDTRQFYNLENLWGDTARIDVHS